MVEHVEELGVESQFHPLGERKPFGDVEVAPKEVGAAQSVAAEISELTGLRRVAAVASSRRRIHRRHKRIWIEPLDRSAGLASGDAQESWPCAKPVLNLSFAAMVASTALLGTPGAMAVPPTVPSSPPWKV